MAKREPKDGRSTYRKRARKVLEREVELGNREFKCEGILDSGEVCGWEPDPTKPIGRSNNLDVNHKNKVISDNDPANLEYLCRDCHFREDRATEKGVSKQEHMDKLYPEGFFL